MKFENTEVTGFENAIWGARLPMCKNLEEAKEKSDSFICVNGSGNCEKCRFYTHDIENFGMNEGCSEDRNDVCMNCLCDNLIYCWNSCVKHTTKQKIKDIGKNLSDFFQKAGCRLECLTVIMRH